LRISSPAAQNFDFHLPFPVSSLSIRQQIIVLAWILPLNILSSYDDITDFSIVQANSWNDSSN
jgi:hypothetical protein